ncbi:hypothetical protein Tco_0553648 [Tanacetum coccineum]
MSGQDVAIQIHVVPLISGVWHWETFPSSGGSGTSNRSLTSSKIIFMSSICMHFSYEFRPGRCYEVRFQMIGLVPSEDNIYKGKGNCGVALNYPCAHRNMVDMP